MSDFDIASLSSLASPKYLCENCLALDSIEVTDTGQTVCSVCKVEYVSEDNVQDYEAYLKSVGCGIEIDNILDYSLQLADIDSKLKKNKILYPPMRILLQALCTARVFVHFTSYGIDTLLLGALKVVAQNVDVRGIVSGVKNQYVLNELKGLDPGKQYHFEAPKLRIRQSKEILHQKLIVVDGLFAFKGSANLTSSGWRKAKESRDIVETVTSIQQVRNLHNRFFSPFWPKSSTRTQIDMDW